MLVPANRWTREPGSVTRRIRTSPYGTERRRARPGDVSQRGTSGGPRGKWRFIFLFRSNEETECVPDREIGPTESGERGAHGNGIGGRGGPWKPAGRALTVTCGSIAVTPSADVLGGSVPESDECFVRFGSFPAASVRASVRRNFQPPPAPRTDAERHLRLPPNLPAGSQVPTLPL